MGLEEKIAMALHPPRCPQCKEKINYLNYTAYELVKSRLEVGSEGGEPYWDGMEMWGDTWPGSIEYQCPACGIVMFTDDDSASKYLKGEYDGPWAWDEE